MSTRSRLLVLGVVGLLLAVLPVHANLPPRLMPNDALIQNWGSTNTMGYLVYLSPKGNARIFMLDGSLHYGGDNLKVAAISQAQAKKLFHDLAAAMPLSSLPVRHGMRSASFGTRMYITYKGQQSPDLTFGGDARANALKADIAAITQALHVSNAPRHPIYRKIAPPAQVG